MADNYKISIDQGATYSLALTYKDSVSGAFPSTYTANNPNTLQPARVQFRIA